MERLADKGNGNYSYLDSLQEARRVLIAEAGSTLVTVAKDVKIQIEFNPALRRRLPAGRLREPQAAKEDFNNDRKDAGEMGAGHTVTALYEIVPAGEGDAQRRRRSVEVSAPVEPPVAGPIATNSTELMNVKVRYKAPDGDTSKLLEFPVRENGTDRADDHRTSGSPPRSRSSACCCATRSSAAMRPGQTLSLAREHRGDDPDGYRAEFAG